MQKFAASLSLVVFLAGCAPPGPGIGPPLSGPEGLSALLLLLVIGLVAYLVKIRTNNRAGEAQAAQILGERYARGEINREQYQRMMTDIDQR